MKKKFFNNYYSSIFIHYQTISIILEKGMLYILYIFGSLVEIDQINLNYRVKRRKKRTIIKNVIKYQTIRKNVPLEKEKPSPLR